MDRLGHTTNGNVPLVDIGRLGHTTNGNVPGVDMDRLGHTTNGNVPVVDRGSSACIPGMAQGQSDQEKPPVLNLLPDEDSWLWVVNCSI